MTILSEKYYRSPIQETTWRRIFIWMLRHMLGALEKLEVITSENMPKEGAAILAANHLSFYDGFVLQYAIQRQLFFMSKAEAFQNPIYMFVMYQMGAFPVQRGKFDRMALLQARRVIKAGQVLGMFPEGTRSYGKGLKSGKTGVAHLALRLNCPIVPVAIDGAQHIVKKLFRRAQVTIKVCQPIYPQIDIKAADLTEMIMKTLAANLPIELRGIYA